MSGLLLLAAAKVRGAREPQPLCIVRSAATYQDYRCQDSQHLLLLHHPRAS